MQIVWSDDASVDYHRNIEYLLREWSPKVASEFIDVVEASLENIKKNPNLYPLTEFDKIRKAVIRKQITLFYKVDGNIIYLVRFWNNYQNPENLKLS